MICQRDAFLCAAKGTAIDIAFTKRLGAGFFGGEGLFFATLTGPGKIFLQSLPFSRMADRIYAAAPKVGGKSIEQGGVLGQLGNLLGGDRS